MRTTAIALIISILTLGVARAHAHQDPAAVPSQGAKVDEAAAWRQVAQTIPLGSKVKVQTAEGKRLSGTLMAVDNTAMMLKRNTRRPEPAMTLPFNEISKLER